jgi:hypothetical protein
MHEQIIFQKQNNRSWVGGDAVIYRSWRVDTVRSLRLPASWPRELIATVIGVTAVEGRKAPGPSSPEKSALAQLPSSSSELVLEAVSVVASTSVIACAW